MKELTFHQIVDKLQKLEPFHFARVGDGEMMCMAGKQEIGRASCRERV